MSEALRCERAEELFSDYHEGQLQPLRVRELEEHLAGCAACREVLDVVGAVIDVLRPASEMAPADDLADRVAAASWRRGLAAARTALPRAWALPWRVQALAAGLAVLVTGTVLVARSEGPRLTQRVSQRSVNGVVYLRERGERLLEDLRVLRVVVATAFEGRVDRVNDRVDDYRRLLEQRRRQTPPDPNNKKSSATDGVVREAHFRTAPGTGS
jgi:hypothetical protein